MSSELPKEFPLEARNCLETFGRINRIERFINRLDNGYSGAQLWQVLFRLNDQNHIGILKVNLAEKISREIGNHKAASFTANCPRVSELLDVSEPVNGWQALVYSVAGKALWDAVQLSQLVAFTRGQDALKALAVELQNWYAAQSPRTQESFEFFWLFQGDQSRSELENLYRSLAAKIGVDVNHGQVIFQGEETAEVMPNPLHYLLNCQAFRHGARFKSFIAPFGPVHGDLHLGNVMVSKTGPPAPTLIDLAYFQEDGSILHDIAYFELFLAFSHIDFSTQEKQRLWENLFKTGWFIPNPKNLSTQLHGLWLQLGEVRSIVDLLAGENSNIQEEYRTAYLHAISSVGILLARLKAESEHLGALAAFYASARALKVLEERGFVQPLGGLSQINWRPMPYTVTSDTHERLKKARHWFRETGKLYLEGRRTILLIGPMLVQYLANYCEADLAGLVAVQPEIDNHEPAWADRLSDLDEGEQKKKQVCMYLRELPANQKAIQLLSNVPWLGILDWSQAPNLYLDYRHNLTGYRSVDRLFLNNIVGFHRLEFNRIPWVALRGAPDPPDYMVWGDAWITQLSHWERRLELWPTEVTAPPLIMAVGLRSAISDDLWGMITNVFPDEAILVNVSYPTDAGCPRSRRARARMQDLSLTPEEWLTLLSEFFPSHTSAPSGVEAVRTIRFHLPLGRSEDDQVQTSTAILSQEEAVRLGEFFEYLNESSGYESFREDRAPSDFLRGYPILLTEIREGMPITRDLEQDVLKCLRDELITSNPRRLSLYHEPGSGGSVLARQVAWKIYRHDRVPALILNNFQAAEVTKRLREFYYKVNRSFLVVVEEEHCTAEQWEPVQVELHQDQIPALVLLINRRSPGWIKYRWKKAHHASKSRRTFFLFDQLSIREKRDLETLLNILSARGTDHQALSLTNSLFGTLFSTFEGNFVTYKKIISSLIDGVPLATAELLKVLAFFRLYGDSPWVFTELLVRLANPGDRISVPNALDAFKDRIVLCIGEDDNRLWAINHHLIARNIMENLL